MHHRNRCETNDSALSIESKEQHNVGIDLDILFFGQQAFAAWPGTLQKGVFTR